jgi:histone acetyltransferase SAS3
VPPAESDDDNDDEEEYDEDAPWEAEVVDDEEVDELETDTKVLCVYVCCSKSCRHCLKYSRFCNQDEDNDPAEEYEEPIECALCGQFGMQSQLRKPMSRL